MMHEILDAIKQKTHSPTCVGFAHLNYYNKKSLKFYRILLSHQICALNYKLVVNKSLFELETLLGEH